MQFNVYPNYKQFLKQKENFCKRVIESFYPPHKNEHNDLEYETIKPFLEEYYHINEELIFYDKLFNRLDNINVEYLTPDGKILDNIFENALTIEIYEEVEVLKETLIDTQNGVINYNGKSFF